VTSTLAAYVSATVVLAITPGATTAVVMRNTLANGWRGGLTAAAGAAVANSTWATCAAIGVAVLLAQSHAAFQVLQVGGGLYLMWLGATSVLRAFRPRARHPVSARAAGDVVTAAAFRQGLLTNLLNPPIVTFYLIVVPTFLPPGGGTAAFALLAAIHIVIAFGCHVAWATAFDRIGHVFTAPGARRDLDAAAGIAILALAARVLLMRR
jgi:threonine/homoserine/homoserine lactone efflux protein